jgi:hypothetical protein
MAAQNAILDILAVSHRELMKTIPDALSRTNPVLNRMVKNRRKELRGGNLTFQFPVFILENQSEGWIDGTTDTISNNPSQNLIYGELVYKFFQSTVPLMLVDFAATDDSPNAIADLMVTKKAMAEATMVRSISSSVYGSGTTANKRINGFADFLTASSGTAYAGINNTTYSEWFPQQDTTSTVVSYATISSLLGDLYEIINQQPTQDELVSSYKVDLMVSRADIQQRYKAQMQTEQRFTDADLVKSGFKGVEVDGIPWVIDSFAPANTLYALSTQSLHFGIRYGFWGGKKSPMDNTQELPNQPIYISTSYHSGNMYCENRRVNAVWTNLSQ